MFVQDRESLLLILLGHAENNPDRNCSWRPDEKMAIRCYECLWRRGGIVLVGGQQWWCAREIIKREEN